MSLFALGWAVVALASVRYSLSLSRGHRLELLSLVLQMFWRMCVVFSRAVAIVSFASVFGLWVLLIIGEQK